MESSPNRCRIGLCADQARIPSSALGINIDLDLALMTSFKDGADGLTSPQRHLASVAIPLE